MEAGTLVQWRVPPATPVARGDIVAEVDTDKGVIEIECFESGVGRTARRRAGCEGAGRNRPRGDPIDGPAAASPHRGRDCVVECAGGRIRAGVDRRAARTPRPAPERRVRVSPLARKRATEMGLDLSTVRGTGPGGAIQVADLERAAPQVEPTGPAQASPLDSMRRAIAAAMARSKREIPHYYLQTRIDMSQAQAWLRAQNQQRPIEQRLLPVVVLLKAVASACATCRS